MNPTITRTAAVTTEQVITGGACLLHAVLPELTTTGTLTIIDDDSATQVVAPASVTGTPGAAGDLNDDEYFAKIIAVNKHGELSAASAEQNDTTTAGAGAGSVAYAWTADPAAVSYRVYIGLVTNTFDGYFTTTTNSFTLTQVATPDVVVTPAADVPAATVGSRIKVVSAIAQLGKAFGSKGAYFPHGVVIKQSVSTDRCAVITEVA